MEPLLRVLLRLGVGKNALEALVVPQVVEIAVGMELAVADRARRDSLLDDVEGGAGAVQFRVAAGDVVARDIRTEVERDRLLEGADRLVEALRMVQRPAEVEPAASARRILADVVLVFLDGRRPALDRVGAVVPLASREAAE